MQKYFRMHRNFSPFYYFAPTYSLIKIRKAKYKKFEQKGDLLNFKVDIDPKSGLMLSCA